MSTRLLAVAMLLLCACWSLMGQTLGGITGEVRDPSGAVVTGARITLTNVATSAVRTSVSNDSGIYAFPSLSPGVYSVRADKEGFKAATITNAEVQVQQNLRLDIVMELGQVTEMVEVSAAAVALQTENATVGTVIENKRIVELPLNGRNYLQLVSLAPNVSFGFPSAGQAGSRQGGDRAGQSISVSGMRNNFNRFTLDGVENTDPNFNTYVVLPSVEALLEFKVQTGIYPAEFGRGATQINVSTRSGGNDFHGSAFWFLRNEKMDAKNYAFTTARPPRDPFKWNQPGFMLSGPVIIPKLINGKNRAFFMANYEWFRQRRNVQGVFSLPSAAMRTGNFSQVAGGIYDPRTRRTQGGVVVADPFPNNTIPTARLAPISVQLLEFYPAPNLPAAGLANNHVQALGRPINKDQMTYRGDFIESTNSSWFGRFTRSDENQLNEALKNNGTSVITLANQYMISNTRTLSPTVVNEARFGYTKFYNTSGTELAFTRDVVSELKIPGLAGGPPVQWGIPNISIDRYSSIGNDSEGPYENNNRAMQFINNTSIIRGKHTIRFGGEIRRDVYNQVGNQFARGQFTYIRNATNSPAIANTGDAFADFLIGEVFQAEAAVSIADAKFNANAFALYIDDTWKISRRLTLSLGLRYENTPPWGDDTGRLYNGIVPNDIRPASFQNANVADRSLYPFFMRQSPARTDCYEGVKLRWPEITVKCDGSLGNRLVGRDNNDWAPRLGISWSPTDKWVIRAGAGMFYSQDTGNPRFDMARNLAGRLRDNSSTSFPNLNWSNALASIAGGVANIFRPYTFANPYDRRTPYTMQYMLNLQRELPKETLFEVGYVGSVSHRLEALRAVNEAMPAPRSSGLSIPQRSPFNNFGRIQLVDNGGNGNYNSLGAKLTKRYSSGITYLLSYTWAKSIDTASAIRNQGGDTLFPQNSYCRQCERALSGFDTRHRFVTSAMWDIPIGKGRRVNLENSFADAVIGGWQISSIVTLQTGFPITVTHGGDPSNTGGFFDRPTATGQDPKLPRGQQDPVRFFNTAAYRTNTDGTFGNVGRNTLTSPGIIGWDFSTQKNFTMPFSEQHQLQFRFEAFNFPNHPNWGNPNTNVIDRNFGVITGTRTNMRNLQLGLRYTF